MQPEVTVSNFASLLSVPGCCGYNRAPGPIADRQTSGTPVKNASVFAFTLLYSTRLSGQARYLITPRQRVAPDAPPRVCDARVAR
jgi:hypothetical protein